MSRRYTLLVIFWLCTEAVLAQSLTRQADRQFNQLAYAKAVELYEQALTQSSPLPDQERWAAQARLGYSYQQMRDSKNAERVFREMMSQGDLPAEYNHYYLYYAQALASNGKYKEAQQVYEKYNKLVPDDKRSLKFSKLYRNVKTLDNANSYKIDFLKMNTRKAEFSPMYYKGGLVFVSTGDANGVKRVFNWNGTPYLDLFFLPADKVAATTGAARLGGTEAVARSGPKAKIIRPLGSDDYTASTANDSRTLGYYGLQNAGLDYIEEPISESVRFSRILNTKYHEGPTTFTKDGKRVIFTRNNYNNGHYGKSADGVNKLKLYTATQIDGFWSPAEEMPFNSNEFSTAHPALSPDDQRLYFASDRPGGFGGTDIYVCRWVDGKWSEPVNLGKEINTKGNELFPFIDDRGNLYLASDGHAGLGGLDLFYAELTDGGQHSTGVRNLGEPFNSPQDDFGLVTDGQRQSGFFSSNRKNGAADDDVYRFSRVGSLFPCRELLVSVFDADSREPLPNTAVTVESLGTGEPKQLQTDADGQLQVCVDADSEINFLASHDGYSNNKVGFVTKYVDDDQPSRLDIPLTKPKTEPIPAPSTLRGRVTSQKDQKPLAGVKVVFTNKCDNTVQETTTGPDGAYEFGVEAGCDYFLEATKANMGTTGSLISKDGVGSPNLTMFKKGDVITIDNIYYDLNKATIRPDAARELDKLVQLMAKYPAMRIEMRSHTDSRASAQYNKTLSSNRAKAAVAYLKRKGVALNRMVAKGYGESLPLNKCKDGVNCTDEEYQQNRRTEIKILQL